MCPHATLRVATLHNGVVVVVAIQRCENIYSPTVYAQGQCYCSKVC